MDEQPHRGREPCLHKMRIGPLSKVPMRPLTRAGLSVTGVDPITIRQSLSTELVTAAL